ncbi:MAG UNVERIFIED_CONTAM: hypothetical protein LVR18_52270 [Planctomycetaceae bacterium]
MPLVPTAILLTISYRNNFSSNFSRAGLTCTELANALRHDGLRVTVLSNNGSPTPVVANSIAYNRPGISFVKWPAGGGAAFRRGWALHRAPRHLP